MRPALVASFLFCCALLPAGTVMDQIGDGSALNYSTAFSSQMFEGSLASYDVAAIDNFTTPAGTINLVNAIVTRFSGSTSWTPVQSWSVGVFSSPAAAGLDLIGDIGHETVLPGGVTLIDNWLGKGAGTAMVSIPVSIPVAAGSYWIAVIPRMDFSGGNGQIGIASTTGFGLDAEQANPNGAFGFGPGNHATTSPLSDLAYSVNVTSSAVPEPATWTALAGGLAALALRRRRAAK